MDDAVGVHGFDAGEYAALSRCIAAAEGGGAGDPAEPASAPKIVNLALQGGGAHGAFAWGVLDRLLEDERLTFEGISATSAGAMNAVVLAYGLTKGGRKGARQALASFWRRISQAAALSPFQPSPWDRLTRNHALANSPAFLALEFVTRLFSPYQFNPLNHNPLRDVLAASVDFDHLRQCCAVKLFLSATNVRSGKIKVFENAEITADVVMASACLPFLFQAVEIEGEAYWDGGYMGNPALFPLIYGCRSPDVVVVHINPIGHPEVPTTAAGILNRLNEISFNSSLMREMRAVAFVNRLIEDGRIGDGSMKQVLIHAIEASTVMQELGASSKLNADWGFLSWLHQVGRASAEAWLTAHFDQLGHRSTADVEMTYL